MTKEKLERIKQAYNSGLKVQIWFNGYWEDFDVRDYSMYSEPFSENRQYRIVGSDYADIAEKRIEELEKENAELKDYRLTTLAKQQTKMSKYALNLEHKLGWYDTQLTKAKELLKDFVALDKDMDWNLQLAYDAEQFLSEVEK